MKIVKNFQDEIQLYITDSPEEYSDLLSRNLLGVPLKNDENKNIQWPYSEYVLEGDIEDFDDDYLYHVALRLSNLPWKILETPRLIVRETTVDDVASFYKIYKDPDIPRFMEDLFENPEDEIQYTKNYIRTIYGFYGFGLWTVICKETNEVVGRAGISMREGFDIPELGFLISKEYQGIGLAYEVCSAIIEYAKKELGFDTLQALVHPDNTKSISLLRKLGFSVTDQFHQGYLITCRTFS